MNARKQVQRTQALARSLKVQRTEEAHLIRKLQGDVTEERQGEWDFKYREPSSSARQGNAKYTLQKL